MITFKILPDDLCNLNGEINITACSRLLAGMECSVGNTKYQLGEMVIDKIAGYNLYNIINVCHGYAHSKSVSELSKRKDTNMYLEITNTNNLLHACGLMLADIIIMYYNSLKAKGQSPSQHSFWTKTKSVQNVQR